MSAFAGDNIGVLTGIINLSDIIKLNKAILVHIELVVSSPDPLSSCSIEVTLEEAEEFIVTNSAVSVSVKFIEDFLGLIFAQLESVVDETPSEIINI